MMIKYEELGVKPITTENKQGNDSIRDIHIRINELLYFFSKKYADNITAQEIINKLTLYANQLKQLPTNNKRDEIINQLRTIVKSLIKFKNNFKWSNCPSTIDALQRTINYTLYTYTKYKQEHDEYNEIDLTKLAQENYRVFFNMIVPFLKKYPNKENSLKLDTLIQLQSDILGRIQRNLNISPNWPYWSQSNDCSSIYKMRSPPQPSPSNKEEEDDLPI